MAEKKNKQEIKELAERIAAILENKNAADVELIEITDRSSLADYFVIASGRSTTQVKALASEVEFKLREEFNLEPKHSEGFESRRWLLLDYLDVVVHIFLEEEREFYNLERLWQSSKPEN